MIENSRTIELMNLAVDGELDAVGAEELRRELAREPRAQEVYAGLRRVADLLETTPAVAPPDDLRPQIMNAVARTKVVPLARPWTNKRLLPVRLALGAAAAILLAFLAAPSLFDRIALDDLRGTMQPARTSKSIAASVVPSTDPHLSVIDVQVLETAVPSLQIDFDPRAVELQQMEGAHAAVREPLPGRVIILDPRPPKVRLVFRRIDRAAAHVSVSIPGNASGDQQLMINLPTVTN